MLHETYTIFKSSKTGKVKDYKAIVKKGRQEGLFVLLLVFGPIDGVKIIIPTEYRSTLKEVVKAANDIIDKKLNKKGFYPTEEGAICRW